MSKRARQLAESVVLADTVGGFCSPPVRPLAKWSTARSPESSTRRRHGYWSLAGAR